jgi:hypothetical protein
VRRLDNGRLIESARFPGVFVRLAAGGAATVTTNQEEAVVKLSKSLDGSMFSIQQGGESMRVDGATAATACHFFITEQS